MLTIILISIVSLISIITFILFIGHLAFSVHPKPNSSSPLTLGLNYQDVYIENYKNKTLHAWWVPLQSAGAEDPGATLVLVHGWGRHATRMLDFLRPLCNLPMNFLLLEIRGHGESSRSGFITQVGAAQDIMAALDWLVLQEEVDETKIGVMGHSFGAAATIYAASEDKRITGFVADASYAHPKEIIRRYMERKHIPYWPLGWILKHYIQMRLSVTLDSIAPENVISKITIPGLLMHGDHDEVVPQQDCQRLISAAHASVRCWQIEGATHSNTHDHPQFAQLVQNFWDQSLIHRTQNFSTLHTTAPDPDLN